MPHIDDGILHAWLDGAVPALAEAGALPDGLDAAAVASHLRTCPDCAARLEAERALREEAGLVMADAGLGAIDVPPFDHVVGAAAARPRTGRNRRLMPLAWAASLVLAVGAGWSAGILWRSGQGTPDAARADGFAAEAGAVDTQAAVASADAAGPPGPVERESRPVPAPTDALASAPATAAAPTRGGDRTEASERPADVAAAESAAPPVSAFAEGALRLEELAVAPSTAGARVQERAAVPAAAGTIAGQAATPPTTPQVVPAPAPAPGALRAEAGRSVGPAAAQVETLREAMRLDAEGRLEWLPLPADAGDPVHQQAWIVAGAGQPSIEVAALPFPLGKLVRSRQRLGDGGVIRLYAWREQGARPDEVVVTSSRAAPQERRARAAATDRAETRGVTPRPQVAEAQPKAAAGDDSGALAAVHVAEGVLPNGEHELVVRLADRSVLIVLRGDVTPETLGSVAQRLVPAR